MKKITASQLNGELGETVVKATIMNLEDNETSLDRIAAEVMALTKMNWNSTQFDQALPIPIRAAREVGRVLRHVSFAERDQTDFRCYM